MIKSPIAECDEQARRAQYINVMSDKVKRATAVYVRVLAATLTFLVPISKFEAQILVEHGDQWTLVETHAGIVLRTAWNCDLRSDTFHYKRYLEARQAAEDKPMIEIRTTIRGGLPVVARGTYQLGFAGTHLDPPEPECVEDA